jgi:hypothetical protein
MRGPQSAGIKAQRARAEGGDLKQTTGNSDILEEMDQLILVRAFVVKRQRGRQGRQDQNGEQNTARRRNCHSLILPR